MDFQTVLRILQRKIWILLGIPLIAVICAFFFVSRMDKQYKSTAQLATGFTADDAVRIYDENSSAWEINTKFINLNESMNSLPVMSLVSYRLIIHDLASSQPFRRLTDDDRVKNNITDTLLQESKEKFKQLLEQIKPLNSAGMADRQLFELLKVYGYDYESLGETFKIKRVSTSDFISIEYLSENPYLSAFAVNALCEEFIRYNKTLKTDRSSESIEFFENLVVEKKATLDTKTTALKDFKVDNNVFNYGAESENKIQRITDYELNKEKEEKNIKGLQLSISTIEAKMKSYNQLNAQEEVQVKQRIVQLKDQITELSYSVSQDDEKLKKLRDELQLEISRLGLITDSNQVDGLKALEEKRDNLTLDLEISRANLASIERSLRSLKYDVSGFATKEARIADLEREVQVASEEYLDAQEKYHAAKNKSLGVGSSLRQILKGQPNLEAEPSKTLITLALVGFSSFSLCLIVLLLSEFIDMTIRIPSQLERLTGLKNIGVVNSIKLKEFDIEKTFNEKSTDKDSNALVHFLRKLRYEVQKSHGKVILLASTQGNVGKSFIIICLSYTLSLINKKILIIDTNFKRNSLTKLLLTQTTEERKLLNSSTNKNPLLLEKTMNGSPANSYTNIISKTKFPGVDLIGNVGGSGSPSEILAGRDFKEMILQLAHQYDFIFMEGPSLNNYADSKELIEYVDKVIAVFGADTKLKDFDKESLSFLKSLKGKLVGSILNKVQLKDLSV